MNAIFTRRSIREYDSRPVEPEKLDRILRAGMQAPSAMNRHPWEFLVVTRPETIQTIASLSPYAKPAARAPMVLVPLVNLQVAGEKNRFWVQDLSASVQNILLQITEEGLGGCWMGIYPDESRTQALHDALHLPKQVLPFAMISIGHGLQENHWVDRYQPDKIHYETY